MIIFRKRHSNFFELCAKLVNRQQLIYVIGKEQRVYIGSIGSREGQQGISMRYQKQYLMRAKAIFGLDEMDGVQSYAGAFLRRIQPKSIYKAEQQIQSEFILKYGEENALFRSVNQHEESMLINHQGAKPDFLI